MKTENLISQKKKLEQEKKICQNLKINLILSKSKKISEEISQISEKQSISKKN